MVKELRYCPNLPRPNEVGWVRDIPMHQSLIYKTLRPCRPSSIWCIVDRTSQVFFKLKITDSHSTVSRNETVFSILFKDHFSFWKMRSPLLRHDVKISFLTSGVLKRHTPGHLWLLKQTTCSFRALTKRFKCLFSEQKQGFNETLERQSNIEKGS